MMDPRIREALWEAWCDYWEGMPEDTRKEMFKSRVADPDTEWGSYILLPALKILLRNADKDTGGQ